MSNSKVASSPSRQNFEYMGFVSLSDNSISNFQSRELKSVSIKPELATHLKLKIGHGWANVQNIHNQVALIGKKFGFHTLNLIKSSSFSLISNSG